LAKGEHSRTASAGSSTAGHTRFITHLVALIGKCAIEAGRELLLILTPKIDHEGRSFEEAFKIYSFPDRLSKTNGGLRETELNELTATRWSLPSESRVVTAATPVGNIPRALRNIVFSESHRRLAINVFSWPYLHSMRQDIPTTPARDLHSRLHTHHCRHGTQLFGA